MIIENQESYCFQNSEMKQHNDFSIGLFYYVYKLVKVYKFE